MDNGLFKFLRVAMSTIDGGKPVNQPSEEDMGKLLEMLKQAKDELNNADRGFDEAADKDLAEYYIYYRKAAEARYNYLIKTVKNRMGISLVDLENKLGLGNNVTNML